MPKRRTSRTKRKTPKVDAKPVHAGGVTYQQKYIRCGKPTCRKWHGPYWYAFWKRGRSTASRYIGKALPSYVHNAARAQAGGDGELGRLARELHETATRDKPARAPKQTAERGDLPTTRRSRRAREPMVSIGGKRFAMSALDFDDEEDDY